MQKNFVLVLTPANWSQEAESEMIAVRDGILSDLQARDPAVKVLDAPAHMSIALISCTQEAADDLRCRCPAANIAPEVKFELPKSPVTRLKPPRR